LPKLALQSHQCQYYNWNGWATYRPSVDEMNLPDKILSFFTSLFTILMWFINMALYMFALLTFGFSDTIPVQVRLLIVTPLTILNIYVMLPIIITIMQLITDIGRAIAELIPL
jgi:hypothetical protein